MSMNKSPFLFTGIPVNLIQLEIANFVSEFMIAWPPRSLTLSEYYVFYDVDEHVPTRSSMKSALLKYA